MPNDFVPKDEVGFILKSLDMTPRNFSTLVDGLGKLYGMSGEEAESYITELDGVSKEKNESDEKLKGCMEIYEVGLDRRCCITEKGREILHKYFI